MKLVLDRIEENENGIKIAVFENGTVMIYVDENSMPSELLCKLRAGIILDADYSDGKIIGAEILSDEENEKRASMRERLDRLKKRKR